MLEQLRMDLGIPKDDALDKIEFGYGSISNDTSTAFFYNPQQSCQERRSTEAIISSVNSETAPTASAQSSTTVLHLSSKSKSTDSKAPSQNPSYSALPLDTLQSESPSPTTIIPTTILPEALTPATTTTTGFSSSAGPNTSSNRSTTTTEEGSGGDCQSDNENDNYKNDFEDDEEEDEELSVVGAGANKNDGRDREEDELSLSESEVTQALRFAGIDDGTREELMGILKS